MTHEHTGRRPKLKFKKINSKREKRKFDPAQLPCPLMYYTNQFPEIKLNPNKAWCNVTCCFHEDENPSLDINLTEGQFNCWSCHEKGRDIVAFHQKRYGLSFVDAVTELGGWSHE